MDEQRRVGGPSQGVGQDGPTLTGAKAATGQAGAGFPARLAAAGPATLVFAAVQFVVVTALAMLAYGGGTEADPAAGAFSFTHNFFSDLGATSGYGGQSLALPNLLFAYGLVCVGVGLILFGLAVPSLREGAKGRLAAALALFAAAVSGIAFVGIAVTPEDVAGATHKQLVNVAFGLLLVFILCLIALELRSRWSLAWVLPNLLYVLVLAVYVWLLFWGPSIETERGLVIQVVAQKIIVYGSILNIGWQAVGAGRRLRDRPAQRL